MKRRNIVSVLTAFVWVLGCSSTQTGTSTHALTPKLERKTASSELDQPWAYDPGPSPATKMGKELIDIVAAQPAMPIISMEMHGEQKFRPAYGPTLWRMTQKPNSVKILFIGQDGTHIAEAAGRTATAGFGGRAQDMAAYFGVDNGAAFMNTFAYTIKGQYSAFSTPILKEENGVKKVDIGSVTENGVWLMAQDQNSPMVKWRNSVIDWIIRNNKDSLKMIVLFGGSAKDSIATFIESKGGHVGSRYSTEDIARLKLKVPVIDMKFAGGNNEFPVVLDQQNQDFYAKLLGHEMNYKNEKEQEAALAALQSNADRAFAELAITNTGLNGSGIIHPAQIGGYQLSKIDINGQRTISLKGLKLSDGSQIQQDVLVAEFPHPTFLSKAEQDKKGSAAQLIAEKIKVLEPYVQAGWNIEPDPGKQGEGYYPGKPYVYGRADIGPAFYDFGTPNNRMVSVSSASRPKYDEETGDKDANVIIIGTRDQVQFDMNKIIAATKAPRPVGISDGEMFNARPRMMSTRYLFDRGPGEEMARIMKSHLDMDAIGMPKAGSNPKEDGIKAFNIKTHPFDVGDFGHYRGTFKNPKVLILADPVGVDDILTSRALTGARGQYLQGLMNDLRIKDKYLIIKTVPFGMDGATEEEWQTVLGQTKEYRAAVFKKLMQDNQFDLVIADGPYARREISGLMQAQKTPVILMNRDLADADGAGGIKEAAREIAKLPKFNWLKSKGEMAAIPRTHLGFMARVWEGTSGTHVFDATSEGDKGVAFAIVAPRWSYQQKPAQSAAELQSVKALRNARDSKKMILPNEMFLDFQKRIQINDNWDFRKLDGQPQAA